MVDYRSGAVDFSTFPDSDGEPVAETRLNFSQAANLMYSAEHYLAPRLRFAVGGSQFLYYDPLDGRRHASPDLYVALDVAPGWRAKWETWEEEGRFSDLVMEFIKPSTQQADLVAKVGLYGRLGAQEYYIYDPAQALDPPLRAYHRVGARLVAQPLLPGPEPAIYSPALGAELRVIPPWLRLIDPVTGQPVPFPEEDREARWAAEDRAHREEEARLAAEERERRLLDELAALRAQLERRDRDPS